MSDPWNVDKRAAMTVESIEREKREVVERVGPWTAHNICLGGDVYTRERRVIGDELRAKRVVQIVSDLTGRPLAGQRVLDLGCMEGLFGIEMALHGATVVGIEGRRTNVDKARFAAAALGLDSVEFVQDDVRHLSREKHGEFDVVLCLGILYHLDALDILPFLNRVSEVCSHLAVVDTHVALAPQRSFDHQGQRYSGRSVVEHRVRSSSAQREELVLASLDNPSSMWLTRPSLYNALDRVGFTSVYECHNPVDPAQPVDRAMFVALKGSPVAFRSSPLVDGLSAPTWQEDGKRNVSPGQRRSYRARFLFSELVRALPAPLKRVLKALLFRSRTGS